MTTPKERVSTLWAQNLLNPNTLSTKKTLLGITLLETLISILLLSLLLSLATPGFEEAHARQIIRQTAATLQNQFTNMKSHALGHHQEVIICGTVDKAHCLKDWSLGYMSFEDRNGNRERDDTELLLTFNQPFHARKGFTLKSCSRGYFRTSAAGPLASIAGTIAINPPTRFRHLHRAFIISRIGRTRLETPPAGESAC